MTELSNYLVEQYEAIILSIVGGIIMLGAIIVATITYLDSGPKFLHIDMYSPEERKQIRKNDENKRNGIYAVVLLALFMGLTITSMGANQYAKASVYVEQLKGAKQ